MKQYLTLLKHCPLFARMDERALEALLVCLGAKMLHFAKGKSILAQGDPARFFGVVLSGSVQVIRGHVQGEHTVIAAVEEGGIFAETLACAALEALPVHVVAMSDCTVMLLEHSRVVKACGKGCVAHSQLVVALLGLIAQKNMQLNQKLEIVMQRTTREKLLAFLRTRSMKEGSMHFSIPFDRQGLADYLGVERSAMSTELNKLKREGAIDFHKNEFTLKTMT